jgi:pullulanase
MQKLAGAIVLTSQGVSFLHAGTEMLRSKNGVENSFESPDSINQIDWSRKARYPEVFDYFKNLIQLRKNHPAFRMTSSEQIRKHLGFLDTNDPNFVAYQLKDYANGDAWRDIVVLYNGSGILQEFTLPDGAGTWTVVLDVQNINEKGIRAMRSNTVKLAPISAMVLFRE